jgi:hypothetical protein
MSSAKEIRYFEHHEKFEAYEAVVSDSLQNKLYVTSARRKADTCTGQHKHIINAHTFMPPVGFKPIIPMFERAKTFHFLGRATTVIGWLLLSCPIAKYAR